MTTKPSDYSYLGDLESYLIDVVNNALDANKTSIYFTHAVLEAAAPSLPTYAGQAAVQLILDTLFQGTWLVVSDGNPMVGFSIILHREQADHIFSAP